METILISGGVTLLGIMLASYMGIKLKFAKTQKEAMTHFAIVAVYTVSLLTIAFQIYVLVQQLPLKTPLDRMSLLAILVPCFSIFSSFVILFVYTIANLVLDAAARSNSRLLGVMEKLPCEKIETPSESRET